MLVLVGDAREDETVSDAIDQANEQWAKALPGLDVSPGEVLARVERLAHLIETRQNARLRRRPGKLVANRGDFDVLRTLRRSGPPFHLTPGEISQQMLVSSAGLSGRLKRLTDEGWIRRTPSSTDARSTLVELTPDGLADLDADLEEHYAFERSLLEGVPPAQRPALVSALRILLGSLEVR
jgi:DNA-binding MarR family transcriptional regulator